MTLPVLRRVNEKGQLLFSGEVRAGERREGHTRLHVDLICAPAAYLLLLTLHPLSTLLQGAWDLGDERLDCPGVQLLRYTLDHHDIFLHEVVIFRDADLVFSSTPTSIFDLLKRFPRV